MVKIRVKREIYDGTKGEGVCLFVDEILVEDSDVVIRESLFVLICVFEDGT